MKVSSELSKISKKFQEPNNYAQIIRHLKAMAKLGFTNAVVVLNPTRDKKYRIIERLTNQGFSIHYNKYTKFLDIEWK